MLSVNFSTRRSTSAENAPLRLGLDNLNSSNAVVLENLPSGWGIRDQSGNLPMASHAAWTMTTPSFLTCPCRPASIIHRRAER